MKYVIIISADSSPLARQSDGYYPFAQPKTPQQDPASAKAPLAHRH